MIVHVHKCRPKNHPFPILAWLIMIFQGRAPWDPKAYSHLAISFISLTNSIIYMDSTSKGVRMYSEMNFRKKYHIIESETLIKEGVRRARFESFLQGLLGLPYDKGQIFGLALKILGFCSYNKLGKNFQALTCNELVIGILSKYFNIKTRDTDDYDLNETWDLVKQNG